MRFAAAVTSSWRVGGSGGCNFLAQRRSSTLLSVCRGTFSRRGVGDATPRLRRGCRVALPPPILRRGCCAADAFIPRRTFPGFWRVRVDGRLFAPRPERSPEPGQRDGNGDGGGDGDGDDKTTAFYAALARRNDDDGTATLLPDLRRRCGGGNAWQCLRRPALARRATTVCHDTARHASGRRSRRPVPGRHTAIVPSGNSHDDRDAAAARAREGVVVGGVRIR